MNMVKTELLRSPEELDITFCMAKTEDLDSLEKFLASNEIDSLFTPPLSDPTRGITIHDRVQKKFESGVWILSKDSQNNIIGCMAVVPTTVNKDIVNNLNKSDVSLSINLSGWNPKNTVELSTVATKPDLKETMKVKGVGESMLLQAIRHIQTLEDTGFVTDSWLGGDMDGFITHVLNKSIEKPTIEHFDFLIQIFSDRKKRGKDGPPTTLYFIPVNAKDWEFIKGKQPEVHDLREKYNSLLTHDI